MPLVVSFIVERRTLLVLELVDGVEVFACTRDKSCAAEEARDGFQAVRPCELLGIADCFFCREALQGENDKSEGYDK